MWFKRAKDQYSGSGAYLSTDEYGHTPAYYIGLMSHLVEDQSVPSHGANIFHATTVLGVIPANPDKLEAWTYSLTPDASNAPTYEDISPTGYYYDRKIGVGYSSIIKTQAKIQTTPFLIPGTTRQYWYANTNPGHTYAGEAFNGDGKWTLSDTSEGGGWGYYGGDYTYQDCSLVTNECVTKTKSPWIATEQLNGAVSEAAGLLMSISESLPPVVQSPSLNGVSGATATVNPGQANTIGFTLLDNRTAAVRYQLFVDDKTNLNNLIFDSTATLQYNPDPTSLPFSSVTVLSWDGLLANGEPMPPLSDGSPHTLCIVGQDEDENNFDYGIASFTVSGAPYVTVESPMGTPYVKVSGVSISTVCPASLNPAMFEGSVTITMDPNSSPIAQLKIKDPAGVETLVNYAEEEVARTHAFETPLDGSYEITVLDHAGNQTFAPFSVGTLQLGALPGESLTACSSGGESCSLSQLKFGATDWYQLEKADLYDVDWTLLKTGAAAPEMIYTPEVFPDFAVSTETYQYGLTESPSYRVYREVVADNEGHTRAEEFALGGMHTMLPLSDDATTELAGTPFMPGALARTQADWLRYSALLKETPVSGSMVGLLPLGMVSYSVLTGDQPDLSDGVQKQLATRGVYYRVWESTNAPPSNCGGGDGGTWVPWLVCHNDTIASPVSLKRFNRMVVTTTLAETTGVFKYFCEEPDGTYCVTGREPDFKGEGTNVEAWGIGYANKGGYVYGGLSARVPAGENVSVKLASWLSLTFDNVSTPGYVEATLMQLPAMPGVKPLHTLNIGKVDLAHSGNIHVALKYDQANVTEWQSGYMEVLKVNDAALRNYDRIAVSLDEPNSAALFATADFGEFMLEVPSYPEPTAYASAYLIGDRPDLGLMSGVPGITLTPVLTGSQLEQAYTIILNNRGLVPTGNAYVLGPTGQEFSIPAAINMLYDKATLAAKKLIEGSLAIYQISEDGTYISKLGNMVLNMDKAELSAEVSSLHSIFVVAGSTEPAPAVPPTPDVTAPVSALAYSIPAYETNGMVMISTNANVYVDPYDPGVPGAVTSGVTTTYYLVDVPMESCTEQPTFTGPAGTCQNPLYQAPFTLAGGTHTVLYMAEDAAGNSEEIKSRILYVDGAAPVVTVFANGQPVPAGNSAYVLSGDSVTMSTVDPEINGPASGPGGTAFDVSTVTCTNFVDYPQEAGDCRKILYTGPFALPVGSHDLYYSAMDNVGNYAEIKKVTIVVSASAEQASIAPSSGPIGVPFTIEGTGFGTYSAGTTVVLLGGTTAPLTLWTDTKIQGTIPGALAAGQYPASVKRGLTVLAEISPFTITAPVLYTLTPSSGAIGLPFTVTGESFGNYVAGFTRVLLGGATMPLTLWTDSKIQGTIPGTLPVGDYELVVERALNGGVVRTSTTTFSLRNMEAYWLAPSSGPIGMPFTISGVGFGNYSSVYTHVLIGDTTAPLTLWTDTKIQGTVPGSLASGQYPVQVERRTSDGGVMQTSPMTFEVVNVDVASMTPVAGPIGMPFTIYGGNFGNYVANYTRVLIGATTCPLTLWAADRIQGTIPGALGPGEYPVIVERELNGGIVQSSALAFTVSTPTAYSISPASGPIGVPFTINGESFGNYSAAYTGVLINGATVPLTLWTDTKIQGTIPGNLAPGQYPVMVGRMTADGGMVGSNALTFEVVGVTVASMTPVAGPIAMPFTIYGTGFGNYSAGYTKVLIGGTTCPLTLWTDTKIQGTVPGSLATGDYQVVVERSLNGGQVQSLPLGFGVTAPVAYTLAPSSGPIGLPFTIEGANFGNYVANYTKVLVGNVAAPLTLWTDTKIQGSIPGSLADGDHEVVVERTLNGGVVRTSTFTFTVGTPYMDAVSPSTASVIAPFTITGYNFGNYVANYAKVLINGTTAPLTLWTDTKIQGKLPFLLAGTYPVQVQRYLNGGLAESATAYINIEEPVISSMTPTSGAVGTIFNLYGTGFGPYDAAIAKVFLGGTQCALSLWTDTRITGTVPSGLTYGTHTVVASRGQALSNALEFYIPGGYSPSMMRPGLSPSALEFKLGEVYVYPDPAKGGKVPTFHIEVGTADSVKIKVFTVAGQLAHEQTLTGSPQAVGSVYAYEYAWTGRIASGVYYYTVEAERAGKKLKAKGRFAVVR